MQDSAQRGATTTSLVAAPAPEIVLPELPALAAGVQLAGAVRGSGFRERQWLIERGGRFLQVTELLYRIAEHADGAHTAEEIASAATAETEWAVEAEHVRHLLRTTLIPKGIVAGATGTAAPRRAAPSASPLSVSMRVKVLGPDVIEPIARVLQALYAPPLLLPALVAIGVAHGWLYLVHGAAGSLRAALFAPGQLLLVIALFVLSGLVHEFGHAAALRYGGGRARGMGCGFLFIYPAFFTDVTDSYRLGRWARVRTDLGGFYFQELFALAMVAFAWASGQEAYLLVVALIDLTLLRECVPFLRLDGYWALADLTGIPDLYSLVGPFVRGHLPGGPGRSALPPLKPWVKAAFAVYVLAAIPALGVLYLLMVRGVPYLIATTRDALLDDTLQFAAAWGAGDAPGLVRSLVQMLIRALPLAGVGVALFFGGRRLLAGIWTWSRPNLERRAAGVLVIVALAGLLGLLWVPPLPMALGLPPAGVETYAVASRAHVQWPVVYPQNPPVGGPHWPVWQNCGFYDAPVLNEQAVHSMEHGAVWITYRPDLPREQVDALHEVAHRQTYVLVSPYPGLPTPVMASAWGHQLRLDSVDDPRLAQFVRAFRAGAQAPERGAPCTGGFGMPD